MEWYKKILGLATVVLAGYVIGGVLENRESTIHSRERLRKTNSDQRAIRTELVEFNRRLESLGIEHAILKMRHEDALMEILELRGQIWLLETSK